MSCGLAVDWLFVLVVAEPVSTYMVLVHIFHSFIQYSVLRQVQSLFQTELST